MAWTVKEYFTFNGATEEYFAWWYLKRALKNSNWTVTGTSNGVSASGPTDYISNPTIMNNNHAYYILKSPEVNKNQRQIYVNRNGATNGTAGLYYSLSGGYSVGNLTSAKISKLDPYGGQVIDTNIIGFAIDEYNDTKCIIVTGDEAENYSWYMLSYVVINNIPIATGMIAYDKLSDISPSDLDPYVFLIWKNCNLTLDNLQDTTNVFTKSWTVPGLPLQNFGTGNQLALFRTEQSKISTIDNIGINPDGFSDFYPIFYISNGVDAPPKGIKGKSKFKFSGASISLGGTALSFNSPKDTLLIGNIALPWVGKDFTGIYT